MADDVERMTLDDYQVDAVDFLRGRACSGLFDGPGVGKTAPGIAVGLESAKSAGGPLLITAPAYLLENWRRELLRYDPELTIALANGRGYDLRHEALTSDSDVVLTSYNNWSAGKGKVYQYPELSERKWGGYVFDEAHRLRGRNSRTTRHVFRLRLKSARNSETPIFMLTGTPIVNNPGDLYPMFYLWDKRRFPGYWAFVGEWCEITANPWAKIVGQLKEEKAEEFRELLAEFALRRTFKDVASLSGLEEASQDYFVEMAPSVKKMINAARKSYILDHPELEKTEFVNGGGALYSRLRQLSVDPPTATKPKIDLIRDLADETITGPFVVYTWYKSSAYAISKYLTDKMKRPVICVTGDVPTATRGAVVDEWKKHPDGVLVATISSLKEGISLTTASHVIFAEHSELPADQEQCVARLKRRGQTDLVNVHHIWADDTPDKPIREALMYRSLGLKRALTKWMKEGFEHLVEEPDPNAPPDDGTFRWKS